MKPNKLIYIYSYLYSILRITVGLITTALLVSMMGVGSYVQAVDHYIQTDSFGMVATGVGVVSPDTDKIDNAEWRISFLGRDELDLEQVLPVESFLSVIEDADPPKKVVFEESVIYSGSAVLDQPVRLAASGNVSALVAHPSAIGTTVLEHPSYGEIYMEGSNIGYALVRAADQGVIDDPEESEFEYSRNPTLLITVHGAQQGEAQVELWQEEAAEKFRLASLAAGAYFHGYNVRWDSLRSNRSQVKAVGRRVARFLSDKIGGWDVVVLGYSRGGIFAHELGLSIESHPKVRNSTIVLLDATASTLFGDVFPVAGGSGGGWLLNCYDDLPFSPNEIADLLGAVVDDRRIVGYESKLIKVKMCEGIIVPGLKAVCSHNYFAVEFVGSHLDAVIDEVLSNKMSGVYVAASSRGVVEEIVVRESASGNFVDLSFELDSQGRYILTLDSKLSNLVPVGSRIVVGSNGVSAGLAVLVASANIAITHEGIAGAVDVPFAEAVVRVGGDDIVNVEASLGGIIAIDASGMGTCITGFGSTKCI